MSRARLLAPLLCLVVTACGTTVPLTQQQQLGGPGAAATTGGLDGRPGTTGSTPGGTTGSALGGTSGSSGGLGSTGGSGGTTSGGSTGAVGSTGSTGGTSGGVVANKDRTPIRVGFEIIKGGNAFIGAAFGTPVNFGDGKIEVNAIVKDVNARGGLGGRPIVPVFGEWNVAEGDPGREAACQEMIQDGKVTFIITVVNIAQGFVACAAKAGVPVINASISAGDQGLYEQYRGFLFSPSLMNLNRELRLVLDTLKSGGKISPSLRVGVLVDGTDPQYDRVLKQTVEPMLKGWSVPYSTYAVASEADVNGAILRFTQDDVKVVVFIAPSGIIEILFMQAAEQQAYRPMYGMGDSTSTWFFSNTAPENQVEKITGVGSLPLANVDTAQYATTPREKRCLDVIRKGGENNAERHSSITATVYCEGIYAFAAVGSRVSGKLTAGTWRAAYPSIGTSYLPLVTFASDFANGRTDNAAAYRTLAYQQGCGCIAYTSQVKALTR